MTTRNLFLCVVAVLSAACSGLSQRNGRSDVFPLSFEPNFGQPAASVLHILYRCPVARFSLPRTPSRIQFRASPLACIIHEYLLNSFLDGTRLPNKATAA